MTLSGETISHAERVHATKTALRVRDVTVVAVTAAGSTVTLAEKVGTWAEKNDADHAAWSSPHTSGVHHDVVVSR